MAKIGLNEQVAEHARNSTDWAYQAKADQAYAAFATIDLTLFDGQIPSPVIGFDAGSRLKKAGEYLYEADEISLKFHFNLRKDLSELETVIALIHNAVHAHNETYATKASWYHKVSFRKAMAVYGLTCSKHGDLTAIDVAVFSEVLDRIKHGHLIAELATFQVIEADVTGASPASPESPVKVAVAPPTKKSQPSKNAYVKFTCGCGDNIRGMPYIQATCRKCATNFIQA